MAFTQDREGPQYVDKLVAIRRVAKVVKGGRRFGFSATVVLGDEQGRVGHGTAKAKEVPDAVRKATDAARKGMIKVPMKEGRTVHHVMEGRAGAAKVLIKPAVPGTGIIAGGPMRAVFEVMGMKDIVAKSTGSNNPINMIRATFAALAALETPKQVAAKRGIPLKALRAKADDEATPVQPNRKPKATSASEIAAQAAAEIEGK